MDVAAWLTKVGADPTAATDAETNELIEGLTKTVDAARKITITVGGLLVFIGFVCIVQFVGENNFMTFIYLAGLVLFGFQFAIGNVQTLPSDFLSGKRVGSLAGFAGMAAKLAAGALVYSVPSLTSDGNYTVVFVIGAALAIVAMASILILCPIRPIPMTLSAPSQRIPLKKVSPFTFTFW